MGISISTDEILYLGFFVLVLLGVGFAFVSNRQERDAEVKALPVVTEFRAPWGIRLFMAILAALAITGYPLMYAGGIFDVRGHRPTLTADTWTLFGLLELICIAIGLPLLYLSGPNDFLINVDRRTYRRVHGWPFCPHTQEGPWEDMAGVFVRDRPGNGLYHVGITWKRSRRDFQHLGMFSRPGEADRHAEQIATTLGLPLVEPPPQCRNSSSVQGGFS